MRRLNDFIRVMICIGLGMAALRAQTPAANVTPAPLQLSLPAALQRARANSVAFQAALVALGLAQAAQTQARAALLPSLNYNSAVIYNPRANFIAANGEREYLSQGMLHEDLGPGLVAGWKSAQAGVALARAQTEIATRGLALTVTGDYYALVAAGRRVATQQQALADAQTYLSTTQELERGGEVAHADVIKAQLELEQQQHDLSEAQLAQQQARLTLAVLLFSNFNPDFTVIDDLDVAPPLPALEHIQALAGRQNPVLAAAQAARAQARQEVGVARGGLLPTLALDYGYGIDAARFATRNAAGDRNLGYQASATLAIPLFDWGANRARLHAAQLGRQQAERELSLAQRQLLANLQGYYAEAQAARDELSHLASARSLAAESLRLTALRYRSGDATILELVDAQNSVTLTRNAYDDGQVRYRVALANLQTLTGVF